MDNKHPELRALFDKLAAEKAEIVARSTPLREQRDAIARQIEPLESQQRSLAREIAEIELPRLAEIDNQLSGLAKAMGGRRMSEPVEEGAA